MFIISYALMGNIISNVLMIVIGLYGMLLFSGFINLKHKDEARRQKFEEYKESRGKVVVFTAGLLALLGIIQLFFSLGFFNL